MEETFTRAQEILEMLRAIIDRGSPEERMALVDEHMLELIALGIERRPRSVLEIGLGWGYSAAAVHALGSVERHLILEIQRDLPRIEAALANIARMAVNRTLPDFIFENSAIAMPELWKGGETFDLILVDGGHRFDNVFIDLFYAGKLAHEGTLLLIDDAWMPSVRTAISFLEHNLHEQWEPVSASDVESFRAFRHTGVRAKRAWDYFVPFKVFNSIPAPVA